MGKSLIDKIQAKLELFRLEQRYTRRRHRRSTFVSNAIYVDGEYVYQTPNSTGSSASSCGNIDALHGSKPNIASTTTTITASPLDELPPQSTPSPQPDQQRKRLNRFSSMPGFGGNFSIKEMPRIEERRASMHR